MMPKPPQTRPLKYLFAGTSPARDWLTMQQLAEYERSRRPKRHASLWRAIRICRARVSAASSVSTARPSIATSSSAAARCH